MKAISQKARATNPKAKLGKFPKRKKPTSKPTMAVAVKKVPLTLKPFKTFLSFIIALIRSKTATRLTILAKSIAMLAESIAVHLCFSVFS